MKEKLHHHHKHEARHHKERHEHKRKMHEEKEREYKSHPDMKHEEGDRRMEHLIGGVVRDNHQEGIERKIVRRSEMEVGQHGSMSGGWKHEKMNDELTPRRG